MPNKSIRLPYSKDSMEFILPDIFHANMLDSRPSTPLQNFTANVQHALNHPIGTPPLSQIAKANDKVCIVFNDITRSCPDNLLVPALLNELQKAGVKDSQVILLCGVGMHRPSTAEEKLSMLGSDVVSRCQVVDHQPRDLSNLVDLGTSADGLPLQLNRHILEADLVISTGVVEPHQYAGYSGGRKTVAIGAAGEKTIAYTHGPAFIDHPATRLGRIQDNPFHQAINQAAHRAGLRFILNVVLDDEKRPLCVHAGEPEQAFQQLVSFAKSIYEVNIPHQYDIAIGGIGYPKDINLYQASRAASYLFFAPTPVVRPGGYIILPARCQEGAGTGIGEQRFLAAMRDAPDLAHILSDARKHGYPPGQQRAFVMAKVLEQVHVIIVGSEFPDLVKACRMIPAANMEDAFSLVTSQIGSTNDVLIVPHALLTLPIVTP